MNFERVKQSYKEYWKNCINFSGKTNRFDYVTAVLINLVIGIIFSTILGVSVTLRLNTVFYVGQLLMGIFSLINGVPGLAICIRRFRDVGKEWYWILFFMIPFFNFYVIYILFQPSVTSGKAKEKKSTHSKVQTKEASTRKKGSTNKKSRKKSSHKK